MGAVLAKKDQRIVLDGLQAQGADIRKATHGYLIFYNNQSAMLSGTSSDNRATMNIRAQIRRMGLTWPLDTTPPKKKDTRMSTTAIQLPKYIMEIVEKSLGVSVTKLGDIRAAVKIVEDSPTLPLEIKPIHDVLRQHGRGYTSPASASKYIGAALYALGYRPVKQRKNATGFTFTWAFDAGVPLSPFLPKELPLTHFPDTEVHVEPVPDLIERVNAAADQGMSADEHGEAIRSTMLLNEAVASTALDGETFSVGEPASTDADFWQGEAERLETELVELRGQLNDANEAFVRRGEQMLYSGKSAMWWAESCDTISRERDAGRNREADLEESVRYWQELAESRNVALNLASQHSNDLQTALDARSTPSNLTGADGWWELERVPETFAELNASANAMGLKIRVQVTRG